MSTLDQQSEALGDVIVVDDLPANLKLLEEMLRGRGYKVRSFPRGRLALAAAAQKPPDLILLDINMPEMDGYEVCKRLKASSECVAVPVIFLSALNEVDDKVKGFSCGGSDYVTKPFQVEEVLARAEVQIGLKRARQAERDLLEHTLNGAVKSLSELMQLISPALAVRARSIQEIVRFLAARLAGPEPWQLDLAATLCLVGCVTLPDDVFERGYCGESATPAEESMFRGHPENGARLLSNIPRMSVVAEMIRRQQEPQGAGSASKEVQLGARMLQLALHLDRRLYRGLSLQTALQQLQGAPERFEPAMLAALTRYQPEKVEFQTRSLLLRDLRAGMILDEDIISVANRLTILKKGTVLNHTWLERIANFARSQGVGEPVRVQIPGLRV